MNLKKEEVVACVLAIMSIVTFDFMGEGGPLPFNQDRLIDLVNNCLPFSFL